MSDGKKMHSLYYGETDVHQNALCIYENAIVTLANHVHQPALAKSQNARAPYLCSMHENEIVSVSTPVRLEAALNEPIIFLPD